MNAGDRRKKKNSNNANPNYSFTVRLHSISLYSVETIVFGKGGTICCFFFVRSKTNNWNEVNFTNSLWKFLTLFVCGWWYYEINRLLFRCFSVYWLFSPATGTLGRYNSCFRLNLLNHLGHGPAQCTYVAIAMPSTYQTTIAVSNASKKSNPFFLIPFSQEAIDVRFIIVKMNRTWLIKENFEKFVLPTVAAAARWCMYVWTRQYTMRYGVASSSLHLFTTLFA